MKSHFKTLSALMLPLLTIAVWLLFAPAQLGGQAALAIVAGSSMEPGFHRGDLVVLWRNSDYHIGDIATYRHPTIGPVIHRIIGREGNRFTFKGDNNTWIDPYRPDDAEMIGKFWLYLPGVGKPLMWLRTPWGMALLLAGFGVMFVATEVTSRQQRHRGQRRARKLSKEQVQPMRYLNDNKTDFFTVLTVLGLALLGLTIFAFSRPVSRTDPVDLAYEQTGVFNYTAIASPGVYTSDRVQTGEPIFRRLVNIVTVNFDYQQLISGLPTNLAAGAYRFVVEINHSNGWKQTIELQPETHFEGNAFRVSANVDLSQIQAMIDNLEQQTGLAGQQYTLTIGPDITLNGTLAEQPVQDKFSPRLIFNLDKLQMRLASDPVLDPSQKGSIQQTQQAANSLSLLGFQLEVATARPIALAGLALCLALLLGLGLLIYPSGQSDAASGLQSKYSSLLISVCNTDLGKTGQVIEVASLADLAKIAERDGRMILHQARGSTQHYFVTDSSITYSYRLVEQNGQRRPAHIMKVTPL